MRLTHHPRHRRLATTEWSRRKGGYILVEFALLLVPLMLLAGLSIDVGYWYNRASDLQKAADAAALAGVVWLPDVDEAKQQALAAAARNGFVHDPAGTGITVVAEKVEGTTRQLRVTIADPAVGSFFFENLGGSTIDLNRSATAEYILPVPLGSPENRFGTDPDLPVAEQAGLWGNIHGPETDNRKGDAYSPKCRGDGVPPDEDNCSGISNPDHRDSGYLYAIDIPEGVNGFGVEIFDAGLYDRGGDESVETGDRAYTGIGTTTTEWTMYAADATELDVSDNPTAKEAGICNPGSAFGYEFDDGDWELDQEEAAGTYKNKWRFICGVYPAQPGRYLLRVEARGDGSAANRYAIRVRTLDGSTIGDNARISAYGDFSMYNNIDDGTASFYLAEVGPEHRGKTLELRMYDPGEVAGTGTMKAIDPSGSVAPECVGVSDSPKSTFTSGSTLKPCKFTTSVSGDAKYNGYWVTLQVKIPNDYDCTPGEIPGCWWKIRYDISGQANDTTTWAAQIIGDPVHLVEEEAT